MRELTTGTNAQLTASTVSPVLFAELVFSSGTVRVWSGYGTLIWNGNNWIGTGALGGVSPVEEAADLQATNLTFTLNGIPSSYLSLVLADSYQGKSATLWLGFLASDGSVVSDPVQLFSGRLDAAKISEAGETCSIAINAESELADLRRSRETRYTDAEQQRRFPGDLGLQYIAQAATQEMNWGRPYTSSYTGGGGGGGGDGIVNEVQ